MVDAVVDIETDAIKANTIHCIVAQSYSNNEQKVWVQEECQQFKDWSSRIDNFIMHNGISFDAPVLNRFTGSTIKVSQVRDTLIESQLYNPVREGGHSLEAWGNNLKFPKGNFNEYKYYSPEMLKYCKRDVELTLRLARTLEKEGKNFSDRSYILEQKIRAIIDQQEKNGFAFNIQKAMILLAQLEDEQHGLECKAEEIFEPIITYSPVKKIPKSTPFNIASRKQIAERLIEKGWKPEHYTDKDNIIINEEVLSKIKMEEAQMFSRYFLLQKRTGLLKAWIQECEEDRRVRGRVLTLKTITGRMAHHSPNMAQVPASHSPYGKECRELWTISNPDTHILMGTDASSLELRCLAHYMNDSKFTSEVLIGDVHSANQHMAGLQTRDQAKTFIYAFLYGAGPAKIGKVVGAGAKEGTILIKRFLKNMPALGRLKNNVQEAAKKGKIKGLDGREFQIRSVHSSLNTLIQGAGAIVCKQWLVHMTDRIRRSGVDVKLVASVHDEYQFEVAKKDVQKFGQITKDAIKETTHTLEMKCNLSCEYKTGNTWAETH
jgi:DNA polymerase-1|tara:strand:+ start:3674 stop:5314 length:1641 start_codon:yes stop_codon:yes gene_type:complete